MGKKDLPKIAALALAFGLASCAPSLSGFNGSAGMVTMNGDKAGSFKVANEQCSRGGKKARVSAVDDWGDTLTFDCVD
jgi:hypothetical protein